MDNNSLSHTTWNCKYHIVFAPKSQNEILNSTVRLCGGIYSNTVDIYYFI